MHFDLFAARDHDHRRWSLGTCSPSTASLPPGIVAHGIQSGADRHPQTGRSRPHMPITRRRSARCEFSTTDTPGDLKVIHVSVFDGDAWSHDTGRRSSMYVTSLAGAPPALDLDANNSSGGGADATATIHGRRTAAELGHRYRRRLDHRRRQHDDPVSDDQRYSDGSRNLGDTALRRRLAAGRHHGIELQRVHRRPHAQRLGVARRTIRPRCARWSSSSTLSCAFHRRTAAFR